MSVTSPTIASLNADVRLKLAKAGIPDPAVDARALVRQALDISQATLLTEPHRQVGSCALAKLNTLVARRVRREPLQYIIGEVEFYGRSFVVDRRVLIPRPETELLIEQALHHARDGGKEAPRILDIGTGSGILAVTAAGELPGSSVVATEISPEALVVARDNAVRNSVDARIEFIACSLAEGVAGRFDIVLCNPPYVLTSFLEGPDVQPELAFEPRGALDGGADGMAIYNELLPELGRLLADGGLAAIEVDPPVVGRCVDEIKKSYPRAVISVLTDLAGLERCMLVENPAI